MDAEPFDRALRRLRRDRAAPRFAGVGFLKDALVDELVARLADGPRFARALDLGCHDGRLGRRLPADAVFACDAGFAFAFGAGGVVADEDRLPFAAGAFDLVASAGALHGVNDLPGALVQVARALAAGGVFVAAFPGGASLHALRLALFEAEEALAGGVSPRVHPTIDPREMAGLLTRAGLSDPVVDVEPLRLRYGDLAALVRDLRAGGETNVLRARGRPMTRALAAAAAARFEAAADADGRVSVVLEIIHVRAVRKII